eukprot:g9874.t2
MDNHVLLVNKPAGLLSQGDRTGDVDVSSLAREYVRVAANKPGEAFVALVHRLDRPVSGVMCVARTSKAAARLSASFQTPKAVDKIYHAVVAGKLCGSGTRRDYLAPADDRGAAARHGRGPRTTVISTATARTRGNGRVGSGPAPPAKLAELEWEAVGGGSSSAAANLRCRSTGEPRTVVRVRLVTGRKHQIRVQLAEMGHPVVGDTRYGKGFSRREGTFGGWGGGSCDSGCIRSAVATPPFAMEPLEDRSILLHASELSLPHPTRLDTRVRGVAPPPEAWSELCGREVIDEVFGSL